MSLLSVIACAWTISDCDISARSQTGAHTNPGVPSVQTQPQSQRLQIAHQIQLSVTASGESLNYQWSRGSTPIPGATNSTYTIPLAQLSDAATYTVTVSNASGTVTSQAANIVVAVTPATAPLKTYYVSTSGSDNNVGTSLSAPLKTITQALNLMANDDKSKGYEVIYVRGGVYVEQPSVGVNDSGSSNDNRSILSAYVDPTTNTFEPVYIEAADVLIGPWVQDGSSHRWYLSNFMAQTSGVWVDWSGTNDGASLQQIGAYSNSEQRIVTGSGVSDMTVGSYYGDLADNRLYVWLSDSSNPNRHTMKYAHRAHTIYQPGTPNSTATGYTYASHFDFVGLRLRHVDEYTQYGQESGHSIYTENDERIINCDVQWNVDVGIGLHDTGQLLNTISNNNGANGVQGDGRGFLINGGQYNGNYWRQHQVGSNAGIKVISDTPLIWGDVRNAEIANNYGHGLWFDTTFENTTISNLTGNYIHDNQGAGIDLEATRNFLVAQNILAHNRDQGILLNACESATIANNTIAGNQGLGNSSVAAVELNGGTRDQGTQYPGTTGMLNNKIQNNIFYNNTSTYDLDLPLIGEAPNSEETDNTSDYNLFFRSTGSIKFTTGGTYLGSWGQTPTTLAAWQSDSAQDVHSLAADPMFVGGSGILSFRLQATSPAIAAGANLTSLLTSDFWGTTRANTAFDLGAFQH